ncbi:MAG: hypothetical protein AAB366_02690 [Patescibacteria group bacterium]
MNNIFEKFNLKKIGLGIAIIIVFNLFVNYGIGTFYKAPEHDDFCKPEIVGKNIAAKEECEVVGGLWSDNLYYGRSYEGDVEKRLLPPPTQQTAIGEPAGWCNAYFTCQKEFNTENDIYKRNVFVVWIIAGVAAIVGSFSLVAVSMLSVSFMFSGLLSLLIGTIGYWSAMQDYLRFIILGIALFALVYVAYKKMKNA